MSDGSAVVFFRRWWMRRGLTETPDGLGLLQMPEAGTGGDFSLL